MDADARMRALVQKGAQNYAGAAAALRIVRLVDEWASVPEIAQEAEKSPSISQGIVRLASSPLYGGVAAKSLHSAIEFLGFEELHRAMMSVALSAWTQAPLPPSLFDPVSFRRRAVSLAYFAEGVARHLDHKQTARFYIAGVFADVGYLFLAHSVPLALNEIRATKERTPGVTVRDVELSVLGFTHGQLSAVAADTFECEPEIVEGVRGHDAPEAGTEIADVLRLCSQYLERLGVVPFIGFPSEIAEVSDLVREGLSVDDLDAEYVQAKDHADNVLDCIPA